uniref:Uncharacterized protein n=1 Tax=Cannabis sativa TaxID=3483 RepID=A0A803QUK7_CANSA
MKQSSSYCKVLYQLFPSEELKQLIRRMLKNSLEGHIPFHTGLLFFMSRAEPKFDFLCKLHELKQNAYLSRNRWPKLICYSSAGICPEKKVLYKLISGLHTSITIHIAFDYLLDEYQSVG